MNQNFANWVSVMTRYRKKTYGLRIFVAIVLGRGRHLSEHSCCRPLYQLCLGQVKIIPGKCSLRVTCPNLVSNTVIYKL